MAELTYNDLLSQLSATQKNQFEGVFGSPGWYGNYQTNPDASMVTGHQDYDQFKAIADAGAQSKTLNKFNWGSLLGMSSADAAIPSADETAAIERDASAYQGEGTPTTYLGAKNPLQDYYEREYPTETTSPYLGVEKPIRERYNVDRWRTDPAFGDLLQEQRATTTYPDRSFSMRNYYDYNDEIPRLQQDDFYENFKNQQLAERGITAAAKNITSPVQDFRFSEYQGPSQEDEGDYPVDKRGILQSLKDRFKYRGAEYGVTGPTGYMSPAQLNRMNALGGYYSEPARVARRNQKRVADMVAKRAAGEVIGRGNLGQLLIFSYSYLILLLFVVLVVFVEVNLKYLLYHAQSFRLQLSERPYTILLFL